MRTLKLGDLLVVQGVLTAAQRDEVVAAQASRGGPFGALAEQMFGVSPRDVEAAWAEQYASFAPRVDPREYPRCERALGVICRRQAWQFKVLPLEMRGRELIACTTQPALVKALKFVGWRLEHPCQFVLADPRALGEAMELWYPLPGMTAAAVESAT